MSQAQAQAVFSSVKQTIQNNHRLTLVVSIGLVTFYVVRYIQSPWRKLPPGPMGVPVFGNLFQLTTGEQWHVFTEWGKVFGDVIYLNVAGQGMVVLNSQKVANELLNRRAGKSSDRPRSIVGSEILTGGLNVALIHYNDAWRRMRKAAAEGLSKGIVHNYHSIQTTEAILLTLGILTQPRHWDAHLRRSAASSIMAVVYDHPPIASEHEPSVRKANDMVNRWARAVMPGAHFVEFFPWMLYIPRSLAKWKREAQDWYRHDSNMLEDLLCGVRDRIAAGENRPSFAATLIQDSTRLGLSESENAWVAGTLYSAATMTTADTMSWWMLAMLAHPETQKRAQTEIDAVVGHSRLPTFADYDRLPYIQAIVKETMRWRPVAPIGAPHCSTEDDWYEGMFIPKGTVYLANVWHLNHDPEVYGPDADCFNPARFLNASGAITSGPADTKEGHFTYGFGRRICVGQHLANASLFINIAMMLWAMNIDRAMDDEGNLMPVDIDGCIKEGLDVRPVPFQCRITLRFSGAAAILKQERELIKQQSN